MTEISIIIPVHNTPQNAFAGCMNSIFGQEFEDYEIIIVDDGSEQKCADYIDTYKEKRNIRIYHREHAGVSATRNYGVNQAMGKYIMFVDSDDVVMPWMLKNAYEIAQKYQLDLVLGGVKRVKLNDSKEIREKEQSIDCKILNGNQKNALKRQMIDLSVKEYQNFDDGACIERVPGARLLRVEIAKKVKFPEGILVGEDQLWNIELLNQELKIGVVFQDWYHYIWHDFSAMHRYRPNRVKETEAEVMELWKSMEKNQVLDLTRNYLNEIYGRTKSILYFYLMHKECDMSNKEKRKIIRETMRKMFWQDVYRKEVIKHFSFKRKIMLCLMNSGLVIDYMNIKQFFDKYKN